MANSRVSLDCNSKPDRGEVCTHRYIKAFNVLPDGTLTNSRVFAQMHSAEVDVPDGMKVDSRGNVFCTGSGGTWVFDQHGIHLGVIRTPEVPANCAFGGPDRKTLFLTARTSLYKIRVKTPGLVAY